MDLNERFIMTSIAKIFLFLSLLIAGGIVLADDQLNYLKSLRNMDPIKDAHKAIKQGNLKYLAVGGYATSVPGVDTKDCLVERKYTIFIKGTGDEWEDTEHMMLQKTAEDYALKYNQIIKLEYEKTKRKIKYKCTNQINN